MRFEGGEGGRLLEVYTDEAGGAFEVGRVLAWKPGDRLVFEWRGNNFEPGLVTEVEVRFERAERGTRVTLEHRGWDRVPLEHASRHGYGASNAFSSMIGLLVGRPPTLAPRSRRGARLDRNREGTCGRAVAQQPPHERAEAARSELAPLVRQLVDRPPAKPRNMSASSPAASSAARGSNSSISKRK